MFCSDFNYDILALVVATLNILMYIFLNGSKWKIVRRFRKEKTNDSNDETMTGESSFNKGSDDVTEMR
jgi:hypothetical protein